MSAWDRRSFTETTPPFRASQGASFRFQHRLHRILVTFAPRRPTVTALVGSVPVGSSHPIVVQSMTNTDTADPVATAAQVEALARAGSQLVRVTVNNEE